MTMIKTFANHDIISHLQIMILYPGGEGMKDVELVVSELNINNQRYRTTIYISFILSFPPKSGLKRRFSENKR